MLVHHSRSKIFTRFLLLTHNIPYTDLLNPLLYPTLYTTIRLLYVNQKWVRKPEMSANSYPLTLTPYLSAIYYLYLPYYITLLSYTVLLICKPEMSEKTWIVWENLNCVHFLTPCVTPPLTLILIHPPIPVFLTLLIT